MSRSVNKIILVGNVGNDPDVRVTSAGVKVKWSYFVGQSEGKAKVDSDWF